ncbi:MAG: GIY-YIG nuclease family protein [Candidatus Marinimicrobia bacterium]|nr:GIY-YIG nuclease family protein [Candidatus Neomarinimicrobiota bacterium]
MFWVYVLYSVKIDRLYVGQTQDLKTRLREHREGASFYTKRASDWRLIHFEKFGTCSDAMRREKQLKTYKGREYLRNKYLRG